MKIIGLTGGIASGKSTVAKCLASLGAHIIDADLIAHQIMEPGAPAYQEIIQHFGEQVIHTSGQIDRVKLGAIVFSQPEELKVLNGITHPHIGTETRQRIKAAAAAGVEVAVLDVPLLYEVGMEKLADEVWVVWVNPEIQRERLIQRDNISEATARSRIASQMPLEEKRKRAQVVIDNNGSQAETCEQVTRFYNHLVATLPSKMK